MTAIVTAAYLVLHEGYCHAEDCLRCDAPTPVIIFAAAIDAGIQLYALSNGALVVCP